MIIATQFFNNLIFRTPSNYSGTPEQARPASLASKSIKVEATQ